MSTCRSCQARIVWAKTAGNRRSIPLDAELKRGQLVPAEFDNGNLRNTNGVAMGHGGEVVPVVEYVAPGPGLWRSHFASCPNSAQHRRR